MSEAEPTAKVLIRTVNEDGSVDAETLWAYDLGDDIYKLDNVPLYAYSVSWADNVFAPHDDDEGFPTFQRIVEKSGNKTVRIAFDAPVEEGNEEDLLLQRLVETGCSYEGAARKYIAVNIPPDVDLWSIREFLIETGVNWEHADPRHSELFPDDD